MKMRKRRTGTVMLNGTNSQDAIISDLENYCFMANDFGVTWHQKDLRQDEAWYKSSVTEFIYI